MSLYGWDEPDNDSDVEDCPVCFSEKDRGKACVVCARKQAELEKSEYQKRYAKERREKLKKLGLCIRCGKEKTEQGRAKCLDCSEMAASFTSAARTRKLLAEVTA